jgi:predicted RecA/RadA family phage recombinase
MKNYISTGKVLTLTAPSGGVVSGTAYLIGGLLVVATVTAAEGALFAAVTCGVVDLPKAADDAFSEGEKVYWDNSAMKITETSGGNTLVGVALAPVAAVVALATDALAADLLIAGLTLQVLDYVQLGSDNAEVTVTVNGVATVLVEGTDWTAATNNNTTATNLAAAINALAGVKAAAVADTVTVVPATGISAMNLTTGRVRLDGVAR